ncbi:hypothetical protein SAMN02745216_04472 [Desulfatibacillum alkenivorans DSM 16219]|jgi:hypothetical protein|uniref:Phosphatidylglycerol lysyltransferase C-terminal domain-containing protein n=1 Tax=Desulfatibacillum alkenivorans DSM 16219 TaxID=1121393 RepID=A0A1M6X693_9BACT|nr:phosphatidylglycerol lysyltransferase domain-containing protein [Desulfatibacillum alkenivorans]SHL01325.1 hypothetical protein SAMN02745216_04472 [Desulfatibacillum alkenivorans DSM 16219]
MTLSFEPINLDSQKAYLEFLAKCPEPSSEYSFINLFAWQEAHGLEWAWTGPLVWIRQTRPETVYWAPMGDWESVDWPKALKELDESAAFSRIPEKLAEIWRNAQGLSMELEEDRGQWDYLYSVPDLVALSGKKYHSKKNHLNRFKKSYPARYVPMDASNAQEALSLQESWCQWRDCESVETLAAENDGIFKVLDHWDSLSNIMGGLIYVEDQLAAYTIGEAFKPGMLLIHFEKGSPDFHGAYQAINQQFLEHEGTDFALVNREQDTGDEGLRKAKMSYHPVDFIKKFRASLNS